MKIVLMLVGLALALGTGQARAADPQTKARVDAIRKEFKAVEKAVAKKRYRASKITLGGGQNPNEILVHYTGGTEADYERDPYATPFHLRRVRVSKMLPAVGGSTLTLYFDKEGELFFAFNTGVDTCGTPYDLRPPSQLRVYFHKGTVLRVIVSGVGDGGEDKRTVDPAMAPGKAKKQALAAGEAVLARARALAQALQALAD